MSRHTKTGTKIHIHVVMQSHGERIDLTRDCATTEEATEAMKEFAEMTEKFKPYLEPLTGRWARFKQWLGDLSREPGNRLVDYYGDLPEQRDDRD